MDETPRDIAKAVAAIGRIDAVPTLLAVLCETTGMRFAVVARVTGKIWTACAVQDDIQLGVRAGGQLALRTNLGFESQASRTPIMVEHASADPRYRTNADPKIYKIESFLSVPIFLPRGRYFGNLCALDPRPTKVAGPHILSMFNAGDPIPQESINKIFEPFWRHSVSGSRNGLGLGLHICSQIVRAHAGQISVTSTAANGTLFTARLPLGTAELQQVPPAIRPAIYASMVPYRTDCSAGVE